MRVAYFLSLLVLVHKASAAVTGNEYFRPTGEQVSGYAKSPAPYHRSPCPALNTLANHGYLPRDGKGIQIPDVKAAVMKVYNLDEGLAKVVTDILPPGIFTLADLGVHNFIEHDTSMFHDDAFFGKDPSTVNPEKVADLISRAGDDNLLTVKILGQVRHDRERESKKTNPTYGLTLEEYSLAYQNAAGVLMVFGDLATSTISVAHATSFLLHERIPSDWVRNAEASSVLDLTAAVLQILLYSKLSFIL